MAHTHTLGLLLAAATVIPQSAAANDNWDWKFALAAQAPYIDGDAGIGRLTDVGVDVDPVDLIEHLDMALMMYVEGMHHNGWGFNLDYGFMDLSDRSDFAGGRGRARANVFQSMLTGFAFKRVMDNPETKVDLYGGFRYWTTELKVDATLGPLSADASVRETWIDPHLGARVEHQLANSKWALTAQGDVGGFGVGSDFAWTAQLGAVWHRDEKFAVEVGYKAIGVDYESGKPGSSGYFKYDTVTHGPRIAFVFKY